VCLCFALLIVFVTGSVRAAPLIAIAKERVEASHLVLEPELEFEQATLTVEGPGGYIAERTIGPGEVVRAPLTDSDGQTLPDGRYRYSLRLSPRPEGSSGVHDGLFFIDKGSGVSRTARRAQLASIRETLNQERENKLREHQIAAQFSPNTKKMTARQPLSDALSWCKRRWCCGCDGDFDLGGSIIKEGYNFLHNYGGSRYGNTALGLDALTSVTPAAIFDGGYEYFGSFNTAIGQRALQYNTDGNSNTAIGHWALRDNSHYYASANTAVGSWALGHNTTGAYNTAIGAAALRKNAGHFNTGIGNWALGNNAGDLNTAIGYAALVSNAGSYNAAVGDGALLSNASGSHNTASGSHALFFNTTGSRNVAVGNRAGYNATTGDDNIFIANEGLAGESGSVRIGTQGTQSQAYIAGISSTAVAGRTVMVDNNGKLGVRFSARRYKEAVKDMNEASSGLLDLRPVTFRYREEVISGPKPIEFGLIAEEVAEVLPELVSFDAEGRPYAVKYRFLPPLLLNELKKQAERLQGQERILATQEQQLREQQEKLQAQDRLLAEQRRDFERLLLKQRRELEALANRLALLEGSGPPPALEARGRPRPNHTPATP
jgi:hypothetical protein